MEVGQTSCLRAVEVVCRSAEVAKALLIVGNGTAARRVARVNPGCPLILLEGAMGMAAAVALGYAQESGRRVIVLEGDGNFLLGSPSAEWLQIGNLGTLHVVLANGEYLSTGGQVLPIPSHPRSADEIVVGNDSDLLRNCAAWLHYRTTMRIIARETASKSHLSYARPAQSLKDQAHTVAHLSGRRRETGEH